MKVKSIRKIFSTNGWEVNEEYSIHDPLTGKKSDVLFLKRPHDDYSEITIDMTYQVLNIITKNQRMILPLSQVRDMSIYNNEFICIKLLPKRSRLEFFLPSIEDNMIA